MPDRSLAPPNRSPAPMIAIIGALTALLPGAVLAGPAVLADDLSNSVLVGTAVKIKDGDSFAVRLDNQPRGAGDLDIRIFGADAPEYRQAGGRTARSVLRKRIEGRRVELTPVSQDRYDRQVSVVRIDGRDIGAELISSGQAWAYRRYLGQTADGPDYCRLEAEARAARRGLWARPPESWVPPWLYRRTTGADGGDLEVRSYASETEADCRRAIPRKVPAATQGLMNESSRGACTIKGNINSEGQRIYHLPGSSSWASTRIDKARGERWFCSEQDARAAGFQPPRGSSR